MKKILFAALVLLAAVSCGPKPAVFTGKITGLKPESKVMLYDIAGRTQEIPIEVDADGNYSIEIKADPCTRYIICDGPKGGVKFYVEPGMKANIDLEFKSVGNEGGEEVYETVVTYTGDNKDAYDFLTEGEFYQNIQNPVVMAHYDTKDLTSFDDFCKDLQVRMDSLVALLPKVQSPVFREWMKNDYEEKIKNAYGWYPDLASEPDDSFTAYLESLDRNGNMDDAERYMSGYSRFWMPKDKDRFIAWFEVLKEKITNKEIVVHDEFECALCKNYDITGIPRFLFFDAQGCILSLDAKRPSDPEIIDWIESLLK